MRRLRAWLIRLLGTFTGGSRDRDLDDELNSCLELHVEERVRAGMSPQDARRHAVLAMGGIEQTKEAYRDQRSVPLLAHFLQDLRYGFRSLRRSRGFSLAAILTLALGLGANMAVFRFVDAILLATMPVPAPEQLVLLRPHALNYPLFRELTAVTSDAFAGVAARWPIRVNLSADGATEYVSAELVSGSYFSTLGVRPAMGRVLTVEDDGAEGAHRVCVVSYDLWQRVFGGDVKIVGRVVRLNAELFEIVGVTEPRFHGAALHEQHDVQIPMAMTRMFVGMERDSPNWTWLMVMARLAPGVSREQAEALVRARFTPPFIQTRTPLSLEDGRQGMTSVRPRLEDPVRIAQLLSGSVLLIACANLAGLLLAKTSARRRELGVRQSLGASRTRIVSQLLVESSLLAGAGAIAGVGLALLLDRALRTMLSTPGSNLEFNASPSLLAIGMSVALAGATALAIGLAPALIATRQPPLEALRDASPSGLRPGVLGKGLISAQVMICFVLVFAAGLFARSLHNLRNIDLGFDPRHVVVLTANPEQSGYSRERSLEFQEEWLRRAQLVPGVAAASLASITAMSGAMFAGPVSVPGAEPRSGPEPNNNINIVTPDYFRTVGLPVVAGRPFTADDGPNAPRVAIVNDRFAEYYWPGRSPLGRQFTVFSKHTVEVVGLVGTAKYRTLREEPQIIIYLPLSQRRSPGVTLHARVAGNTAVVAAALERTARSIDSNVPVYDIALLSDHVNARLANERVLNALSVVFASLGLLVAGAGIYGLIAYAVVRRRREIGIRLAIGAQPSDVLALFLRDVVALVGLGVAAGIPLAFATSRQFEGLLYGLEPSSTTTLIGAATLLTAISAVAAGVPARRATRVDPVWTLREV